MKTILFQISSHWDREWYRPHQGFRYYLVEMLDRLIAALEDGSVPEFVMDGQTVVLEDYLEIRPENRARLEALIGSGKLKVGPWYVMPDEFCISGEGLIENLLIGQGISRSFGTEPWKFGYVNDIFGHVAALPQIFRGFGIDGVFLGRGVSHLSEHTFFRWRAPDGSECVVYKECYALIKREFLRTSDADREAYLNGIMARDGDLIVLNYTDDHAVIDSGVYAFLEMLGKAGARCIGDFSALARLAEETEPSRRAPMPVIEGELAETGVDNGDFRLVTHSISSYYPLKRENDFTESLLWNETAPLLTLAGLAGLFADKENFFRTARRHLIQNHPHDSICGCSVDAVHGDMPYRFHQAQAIADVIGEEFRSALAGRLMGEGFTLVIANPDVHPRCGTVTVEIDFPTGWKPTAADNTGYQSVNLFRIVDRNGREVPYQILRIRRNVETYRRQAAVTVNRYTAALDTELAPFGFTPFSVLPAEKPARIPPAAPPCAVIENEYLHVRVQSDGSLCITDRRSGRTAEGFPSFIDDADTGNGWFHGEAAPDEPRVLSEGTPAVRIERIHTGPLVHTLRVTRMMEIPAAMDYSRHARSDERAVMTITADYTLRRGEMFLDCTAVIDNPAGGHRLRMMLPTGMEGEHWRASQAFGFVERPRGVTEKGLNGREPEYVEKNTSGIVLVGEGLESTAFVGAEGFHEVGVYPDGTVSVTVFRSVGKMFHQPEAERAKLIGRMPFHFAFAFGMNEPELLALKERLCAEPSELPLPVRCDNASGGLGIPVCSRRTIAAVGIGKLPEEYGSFLSVSDARILQSVVKPAEEGSGFILRLYNPTDETVPCTVKTMLPVTEVTLAEEPLAAPERTADGIRLPFGAHEIHTLRIG